VSTWKRLVLSACLDRSSLRGAGSSDQASEFSNTSLLILWKFSTGFSELLMHTFVSTCSLERKRGGGRELLLEADNRAD